MLKHSDLTLEPLGDRVLLKVILSETTTPGGIIIPTSAQKKTEIGEIVAVGPGIGRDLPAVPYVPGSRVIYDKYAGTSIDINGEAHLLLREVDVLAVVKG
jgi:chaperonin GroES